MSDDIRMALNTFSTVMGTIVQRGDLVRVGHPVMEGREHMFGEVKVKFEVEQATAIPGEVRSLDLSHMDTRVDPDAHTLNELKDMAEEIGVADYGTKADIAKRINTSRGHY